MTAAARHQVAPARRAMLALRCRFGLHRRLQIIQSFGASQHIGCPDCGREWGIHHGMRAVASWDPELDQLYRDMGYDTAAATARWRERRP